MSTKKLGLYIHMPFCVHKCSYCGFVSYDNYYPEVFSDYLTAVIKEIELWQSKLSNDYSVDTIYIGGGTPSLLQPTQIKTLITAIKDKTADCEITMEANPETLNRSNLEGFRESGINRLSIGIQSFDDEVLKILGRIHDAHQGKKAIEIARQVGFDNISIDLMFSLPGQSIKTWENTLIQALDYRPEHLSFYGLQIEEKTPFYNDFKNDVYAFPDATTEKKMYYIALNKLEDAAYSHYEISNAAIDRKHFSRHNMKYWTMKEYLGIGVSASSFLNNKRYKNTDNLQEYLAQKDYFYNYIKTKKETSKDLAGETVFTGLRLMEGFDLTLFKDITGQEFFDFYKGIDKIVNKYLTTNMLIYDKKNNKIKLAKDYIMNSNSIMADFV